MKPLLTRELIRAAHPHKVVDDPTVMVLATDNEIAISREVFLGQRADPGEDMWLFGYGSLMWKPELEFAESLSATAIGWHRQFCLWQWRYRGSRDHPGLMLALDRGGSCCGVAYKIAGPNVSEKVAGVWRREMIGKGYRPRWLSLRSAKGPTKALGFVADREGPRYAGHMPLEAIADHIAAACGANGPSAEYLLETRESCRLLGIRDDMLEQLHDLVAERLQRLVQNQ